MEMTFILSFRSMRQRSAVYLILAFVKCLSARETLIDPARFLVFLPIPIFGLAFYLLQYFQDRKTFKMIYESRDKLKKFQQLLSNDFPLSVVITDSNLGRILYSNKVFQTSFSQDNKDSELEDIDILKQLVVDPTNVSSSDSLMQLEKIPDVSLYEFILMNHSRQDQENAFMTLNAIYKKDSKEEKLYYEVRLSRIQWGEDDAYALVLNDVSDKQTVIALKLADQEKEKVIATISHELKTPINGILGLLEMIGASVKDDEVLDFVESCKSCSKLLLYLVNSILNLNELRSGKLVIKKESFRLEKYLQEIKSLYIFNAQQKGIDFIINKDPRVSEEIYIDQNKLTGILINLLNNAIKFTLRGSVTLSVYPDVSDRRKTVFCVEDTGIGIDDVDKSRLFKMFGKMSAVSNERNSTKGVGLGLSIASGLVEALTMDSEKIEFKSQLGKGSKFSFKIETCCDDLITEFEDSLCFKEGYLGLGLDPESNIRLCSGMKYKENSERFHNLSLSICSQKKKFRKHVLLVDDFPLNLMTAQFIFEDLGWKTSQAFSAKEALEFLKKKRSKGVCLVVTNLQMFGMNGFELSKEIVKMIDEGEIEEVSIVGLTEKKLLNMEEVRKARICFTLEKPLMKSQILEVVKKLGID